jgi:type 1 glutamine amidotransferase/nicotinamidase-related amidase
MIHRSSMVLWSFLVCTTWFRPSVAQDLKFDLRYQVPVAVEDGQDNRFHRMIRSETWPAARTAVIVCDMWDAHHCLNAVRRVNELAPRMDLFLRELRERGVTVIHAPSSCMAAYEQHPARLRAQAVSPAASFPDQIADWCHSIPSEEAGIYPVDQSDGGEDDEPFEHQQWADSLAARGLNPRAPWKSQTSAISIDPQRDYISDSGTEIWSILQAGGLDQVILVGVHTNMCVLGRPFGLRRMSQAGKNVVLARDLTDTMYNPAAWPYASHFTGTDRIIDHIERFVCPTINSGQLLGEDFRFSTDRRVRLAILIGEDEYQTESTLPTFAERHLSQHFSVQMIYAHRTQPNEFVALDDLNRADALLVSVRRRPLPAHDLKIIRDWVASGKPVIGIRTASHAFSLRNQNPAAGLEAWPEFDAQVFGGSYTNHYGVALKAQLSLDNTAAEHAIVQALGAATIETAGSLYKTAPLAPGTRVLMTGRVEGQAEEPVAWTFIRPDGGRSFYTSLGHPHDFQQPSFMTLLSAGVHWACGLTPPSHDAIAAQEQRFAQSGRVATR